MLKANPPITKEFILQYVRQEEIMEKYIGVSVSNSDVFCSPSWIRNDENPTCNYSWDKGTLYFRDWSVEKGWDCFNVVENKFNVNFYDALKIIAHDFNLTNNLDIAKRKIITRDFVNNGNNNSKSTIGVKVQPLTKDNIEYLTSYHLTKKIINKFKVFSPEYVWLNGKLFYAYSENNPALAYYFGVDNKGNEKWKIYFYKKKGKYRFLTNTNRINGWVQLDHTGDTLVITKSLKDVMCFDIFGIPAISMQAETQTPYDYIIKELKERFKNIVCIFDRDSAGYNRAGDIYTLFDIPYAFIIDDKAKDFSDYIQYYGIENSGDLITKILYD